MKLLYITNGVAGSGGLERVLSIKASYLADKLGYEVHIITLNEEGLSVFFEFNSKIIFHNIIVNGSSINFISQYIKGINAVINNIKPQVISVCDDGLKAFFLPIIIRQKQPMNIFLETCRS